MYLHGFFFSVMSINLSFLMNTLEKNSWSMYLFTMRILWYGYFGRIWLVVDAHFLTKLQHTKRGPNTHLKA